MDRCHRKSCLEYHQAKTVGVDRIAEKEPDGRNRAARCRRMVAQHRERC